MGILKYVLLALVLIWLWYSPALRSLRGGASRRAAPTPPKPQAPEEMVSCAHCGVHLPRSEALIDDAGRPYCGSAHRAAGPARP